MNHDDIQTGSLTYDTCLSERKNGKEKESTQVIMEENRVIWTLED